MTVDFKLRSWQEWSLESHSLTLVCSRKLRAIPTEIHTKVVDAANKKGSQPSAVLDSQGSPAWPASLSGLTSLLRKNVSVSEPPRPNRGWMPIEVFLAWAKKTPGRDRCNCKWHPNCRFLHWICLVFMSITSIKCHKNPFNVYNLLFFATWNF